MGKSQDSSKEGGSGRDTTRGSAPRNQPAHFAEARRIVDNWPEWKKNICFRSDSGENGSAPSSNNEE